MAMKEGKDSFPYSTIYAFKKGDDGKPEIIRRKPRSSDAYTDGILLVTA